MPILPDMYPCKPDIFEATYSPAALAAGQATAAQAVVPANMQVTEKMRAAGDCAWMTADRVDSALVFRAMLAAAPAAPTPQADSQPAPVRDESAARDECKRRWLAEDEDCNLLEAYNRGWKDRAARATADSVLAPAARAVAGLGGKCMGPRCMACAENGYAHSRECIDESGETQGWKPTAEDYAKCGPSTPPAQAADSVPSRFGSPELQAMILARCVEKDQAYSVQEDAARYRWLRATTNYATSKGERIDVRNHPDLWDAAIDAARKQGENHDR